MRMYYRIDAIRLLYVSVIYFVIFREVFCEGYITKNIKANLQI